MDVDMMITKVIYSFDWAYPFYKIYYGDEKIKMAEDKYKQCYYIIDKSSLFFNKTFAPTNIRNNRGQAYKIFYETVNGKDLTIGSYTGDNIIQGYYIAHKRIE